MRARAAWVALALPLLACAPPPPHGSSDTGLDALALTQVDPGLILPGTRIQLTGRSFVDSSLGQSRLHLTGTVGATTIDQSFDLDYVSSTELDLVVDPPFVAALGGTLAGSFSGEAAVDVFSSVDGRVHSSRPLTIELQLATQLSPRLDAVADGMTWVNQPIRVTGDGFLLGGAEGETHALVSGCFTPTGATACTQVSAEVAGTPVSPFDRSALDFPYASAISGVGPGIFDGKVTLTNVIAGEAQLASAARAVHFTVQLPILRGSTTSGASLGQYVDLQGNGFVGGSADEVTLLAVHGTFTPSGGAARGIDATLVPDFVAGPSLRYVLDEADPLGALIKLRSETGRLSLTATPIVEKGAQKVTGTAAALDVEILPVKQVVWLHFMPSYVTSLRKFGLRAADALIRKRVLQVAERDYAGVNIDFRSDPPSDFALYSEVDIAGPDPNGLGLIGYDNSPGKDVGNQRLYDHVGGVNASTEEDGSPGFGGVFTEAFFGFSNHPNNLAAPIPEMDTPFDLIFDPFRPDQDGVEVTASELVAVPPPPLTDGSSCGQGGDNRAHQIACAVWTLGNLIGTTMTHEVGHSLGLADPNGDLFHDPGDLPNRLMEAGEDRPFDERAELDGKGPAVFCADEYTYLRQILPSSAPATSFVRPPCN